ncbi:HNH endonuclease [Pseudomonas putida]|uniref:HNH endonuclease n=1 Tax=Pseudomonas putida TaxID=303 RepID=UPI003F8A510C
MSVAVNPLQRALIEKAGHDNGFEHVLPALGNTVILASARHRSRAAVVPMAGGVEVRLQPASPALVSELLRSFKPWAGVDGEFCVPTLADLSTLLRRAASLSQALPNQAVHDYHTAVTQALADLPSGNGHTEVERLVRQRVGQDHFREALLIYWGGACAVTGITVAETLRASHAKPWAQCADDVERLDSFNGFLLAVQLDALFDRFLISFDDDGNLLVAGRISPKDLHLLGIHSGMALRWVANEHRPYLRWHRERFLLGA